MNNTGVTILSILMPTIPEREDVCALLSMYVGVQINAIETTHPMLGNIELLIDNSKSFLKGGLSIGKKRESLVRRATGKYLCFLDDDEDISPNYIETLLRLCQHDADVITFRNLSRLDDYWMLVDMGLHYPNDGANPNFTVRRKPWHICPVKSEFAKLYDFEDSNYSEDWTWMEKVLRHCTTEAKTQAVLHMYNHSKHKSEADKITNHFKNVVPE